MYTETGTKSNAITHSLTLISTDRKTSLFSFSLLSQKGTIGEVFFFCSLEKKEMKLCTVVHIYNSNLDLNSAFRSAGGGKDGGPRAKNVYAILLYRCGMTDTVSIHESNGF